MTIKPWVLLLSLAASLGGGLGLGVVVTKTVIAEPVECTPPSDAELLKQGKPAFQHAPVQNTGRDKGY
ncbi:TPA: hypothetical protein ACYZ5L_003986 [Escherichia coli]|nr:hypothetical protein [Salmonella enterica]EKD5436158.1 hypothetical protein [Salmonella enterica subsp. enterica serovar Montevideo]